MLLVLISRQIYIPASTVLSKPSTYTLHLVQKTPRRHVLTVLCSLLNTVMNSPHSHATGLGSVTGKLPYNHLVFKGEDTRTTLVTICFQVLCAILDFQSGDARDAASNTGECHTFAPTPRTNAFRYFLAKLVGEITQGLVMITQHYAYAAQDAGLCVNPRWNNGDSGTADGNDDQSAATRSEIYTIRTRNESASVILA